MDYTEDFNEILHRTFADFMKFCEREGFRWYLAFGAAIGAVRHKGMIPWDDDIDVYMPREDYMKFISRKERISDGLDGTYEVLHVSTSEQDLPFSYAKFCDCNSTIWEQEKYPCTFGVFIDVFPLDETGRTVTEANVFRRRYKRRFFHYKRGFRDCSWNRWVEALKEFDFHKAGAMIYDKIWFRPRKELNLRRFLEMDRALAKERGESVITYDTLSPTEKIMHSKSLFANTSEAEFDGLKVLLPSGNAQILKQIYGDYMQLPPERERISNHYHFFVDLHRRLTVDQIREMYQ